VNQKCMNDGGTNFAFPLRLLHTTTTTTSSSKGSRQEGEDGVARGGTRTFKASLWCGLELTLPASVAMMR
jgi:hypothetical protein